MITKEDVKIVASQIKVAVTDEQIEEILQLYPSAERQDKTATWNLIVEQLIYETNKK